MSKGKDKLCDDTTKHLEEVVWGPMLWTILLTEREQRYRHLGQPTWNPGNVQQASGRYIRVTKILPFPKIAHKVPSSPLDGVPHKVPSSPLDELIKAEKKARNKQKQDKQAKYQQQRRR